MSTVNIHEAKTHFSQLLEQVEKGQEITITKRGKAVAKLIPYRNSEKNLSLKEIICGFRKIRKRQKSYVNIRELIEEGRKY